MHAPEPKRTRSRSQDLEASARSDIRKMSTARIEEDEEHKRMELIREYVAGELPPLPRPGREVSKLEGSEAVLCEKEDRDRSGVKWRSSRIGQGGWWVTPKTERGRAEAPRGAHRLSASQPEVEDGCV